MTTARIPLVVDVSGTPTVKEVPDLPGEDLAVRVLPLATTLAAGAMSAADKVALDGTPAAIAAAVSAEASTRSSADAAETAARIAADAAESSARQAADNAEAATRAADDATEAAARIAGDAAEAGARAAADAALDGRVDTLETTVAALDPLGEQNAGANLSTAAPLTPPEELGLFAQRNAGTGALEFRTLHPGALLQAELVGDSVRLGVRPGFWTPPRSFARRARGYRDVRRQGVRTAGAVGDLTFLADNHGSAHLYPRMTWAALDWYGFPHNRHKRLESGSLGNDSGELGYEFGHDVGSGDFRDGRALVWRGRGKAENAGWADAFWDWTVEVDPTVGVFNGPNRLRLISPALEATWTGELWFDWEVVLRSEGWKTYSAAGRWTIFSAGGGVLREWRALAGTSSGFDFLAAASRIQLSWRVDRDHATRLDTYDETNQGANQGANRLRCSVRSYALDWDGFPKD